MTLQLPLSAHLAAPGAQRERRLSPVSAPAMPRDQGRLTARYDGMVRDVPQDTTDIKGRLEPISIALMLGSFGRLSE